MPTVLRSGPYRFFFYASDRNEPQHVHVERDDKIAKFWLEPIRLQSSGGFSRVEMVRIEKVVNDHRVELMETWNEYFGH
ncbi:MAG: DUF4160 domain-containing protein [Pseudomonadota bacterium]|nr:DUF4160 domain-containing protein [Pseudomonadota bacterium]